MALDLPKKFTDIPLAHLWEMLKIVEELKNLANTAEEKMYWEGAYDIVSTLLGDLVGRRSTKLQVHLANKFQDFRMEDKLRALGEGDDL